MLDRGYADPGADVSTLIEIILACRSVGGPYGQPPSAQQHAALIVNCGANGVNEHWLAQGGPQGTALRGGANPCSHAGWWADFSQATGAYWDRSDLVRPLAITVVARMKTPRGAIRGAYLRSQATALNSSLSGTPYNYENGPNSNTWVKLFMERLGLATSLPANAPVLKAWGWHR